MTARDQAQAQIRAILEKTGWSGRQLAMAAGVHPSTVFRALSEDATFTPSLQTMSKLAGAAEAGPTSETSRDVMGDDYVSMAQRAAKAEAKLAVMRQRLERMLAEMAE